MNARSARPQLTDACSRGAYKSGHLSWEIHLNCVRASERLTLYKEDFLRRHLKRMKGKQERQLNVEEGDEEKQVNEESRVVMRGGGGGGEEKKCICGYLEIAERFLGVSGVSELGGGTKEEWQESRRMTKALERTQMIEEECGDKMEVMERLKVVCESWANEKLRQRQRQQWRSNEHEEAEQGEAGAGAGAAAAAAELVVFGSTRMGLRVKGSDLDVLLMVPRGAGAGGGGGGRGGIAISREEMLTEVLKQLKADPWVTWAYAVNRAYLPLIKAQMSGICIDLVCARVDSMPTHMEMDDEYRLSMEKWIAPQPHSPHVNEENENGVGAVAAAGTWCADDAADADAGHAFDMRSFRGLHITANICKLVYDRRNFIAALRVIRVWAKSRNISSNATGFLGGVGWAILTAYICQIHPIAAPATLIYHFFQVFSGWEWSKEAVTLCRLPRETVTREKEKEAVMVTATVTGRQGDCSSFSCSSSSRGAAGGDNAAAVGGTCMSRYGQYMRIMVPCVPTINCAYKVGRGNLAIIQRELQQAHALVQRIRQGESSWDELFRPTSFFTQQHYLVVIVTSSSVTTNGTRGYTRRQAATDGAVAKTTEDVGEKTSSRQQQLMKEERSSFEAFCGLVQSRLRFLVSALERKSFVLAARLNPRAFDWHPSSTGNHYCQSTTASGPRTAVATREPPPPPPPQPPRRRQWFISVRFNCTHEAWLNSIRHLRPATGPAWSTTGAWQCTPQWQWQYYREELDQLWLGDVVVNFEKSIAQRTRSPPPPSLRQEDTHGGAVGSASAGTAAAFSLEMRHIERGELSHYLPHEELQLQRRVGVKKQQQQQQQQTNRGGSNGEATATIPSSVAEAVAAAPATANVLDKESRGRNATSSRIDGAHKGSSSIPRPPHKRSREVEETTTNETPPTCTTAQLTALQSSAKPSDLHSGALKCIKNVLG
ncbi:hypothetical protein Aperf_G00000001899 [Anoplocephala perfoliata]